MKRNLIVLLFAIACAICTIFAVSACGGSSDNNGGSEENSEIYGVYQTYVAYAESNSQTPLSYEAWLASIKGEKGETGATGATGATGNGIVKIEKTSSKGLVDTYTIYFTDGAITTFTVTNGKDGEDYPKSEGTEGLEYFPLDDGTYAVECGNAKYLSEIVIPSTHNGKPVTVIGKEAFSNCTWLKSITIPDTVTSIGDYAFEYCRLLTIYCEATEMPSGWNDNWNGSCPVVWNCKNNDKDADGYAYSVIDGIRYSLIDGAATVVGQPTNITEANIPATVEYKNETYSVTTIGGNAFAYCSSLVSITIPGSVTSIGESAFYNCGSLKSITIPDSVTSIGDRAFVGCSLLTSITIPENVTSIGREAFEGCRSLTSITIPDTVMSIGKDAFYNTAYYNNEDNWENGVLYIGNHLIQAKTTLSGSYEIKQGTKTVADDSFLGCRSLESLTIPDSVTSIGYRAFFGCSSLTSVTIGDGVTSIGGWAFLECSLLTDVYYTGSEEDWAGIYIENGNDYLLNATIHYN